MAAETNNPEGSTDDSDQSGLPEDKDGACPQVSDVLRERVEDLDD
jgi:hypothetical protein